MVAVEERDGYVIHIFKRILHDSYERTGQLRPIYLKEFCIVTVKESG